MVEAVYVRTIAAESDSPAAVSRSVTIYLGTMGMRRLMSAQATLSRVAGGGTAKASISGFTYMSQELGEPIVVPVEPPASASTALYGGSSTVTAQDVISVTFFLRVTNMYAYATCYLFLLRPITLLDAILAPFRLVLRAIGR